MKSFIVCFFVLAATASASSIAYSDFGAGTSFGNTGGTLGTKQFAAVSFTSAATGSLLQVRAAISTVDAVSGLFVELVGPSATPTGTLLELWTITSAQVAGFNGVIVLSSVSLPVLNAGSLYWLLVDPPTNPVGTYTWFANTQGAVGLDQSTDGFVWTTQNGVTPAFDVTVGTASAASPEPGTWGLVGIAVGACLLRKAKTWASSVCLQTV